MTRRSEQHGSQLLEQTDAVRGYLDELLRDLPTDERDDVTAAHAPESQPLRVVSESAPLSPAESPEGSALTRAVGAGGGEAGEGSLVPPWASPQFQALLFEVGSLKLAVPLVKLHSVVPFSDHIAAVPRQPEWVHGMMRYRGRNVLVIDTARLVLPSTHADADAAEGRPEHMLIVGDGRWGLACRRIGDVVRLTPGEVRWRSRAGRRPWLAGTVLGRLCALMDTEAFADMLSQGAEGAALSVRITENE
ncbi:chemotaxis protein CheW [Arhodomonas aquaeolei]|uniref:chemotaxis protein CheW n=1 Tax=Arhodomonas aquaeolei TaxID=2369 RepID=UPI000360C174|nr:chemotaxis protein CheW [Arhodomonas aquaeolei]